ncbi:MAG: PIG-L deacetylase family protein [Nocardioidaceae bacterium]
MTPRRLLVVGAHSADFVWRSAGAIAAHTARGGEAIVVALSYGERGESGVLWKEEGQTEENVKRIRHEEASKAAEHRGNHARKVTGNQEIRQAEALQRLLPNVVEAL